MAVEDCRSYVVSRSGKVLDSCGRVLQEIGPAAAPALPRPRPLATFEGEAESFYNLAALLLPPSRNHGLSAGCAAKKRKFHQFESPKREKRKSLRSTCVWEEEEVDFLDDLARAILRRQKRSGRKSSRKSFERLVQHLKVGVSQVRILQRWEAGSREQSARWASWLLKILRRSKPPHLALQRFLFTVLVAILPVICCNLMCQTLRILPDAEVLNATDILCSALEKSWSSFTSFQWEILEERICQCRQARLKAGTWLERRSETRNGILLLGSTTSSLSDKKKVDDPSLSSSSDEYAVYNDEQLSNELVLSEGVKALVQRALRERQILPSFKKNLASRINNATPGTVVSLFQAPKDVVRTVSASCPLSGKRVKVPARGISCTHLTCFDLEYFLEENARVAAIASKQAETTEKPVWRCPYCGSDATWPQIIVDGFILRILKALPGDTRAFLIWPDGRWGAMEASSPEQVNVEQGGQNNASSDADHVSSSAIVSAVPQQHERNVRPRLDADDSTWNVRDENPGVIPGNEASSDRRTLSDKLDKTTEQAAGGSQWHAAEGTKNGAVVDSAAGSSRIVPILHEINLQDLIQSTLEKARCQGATKTTEHEGSRCERALDGFKPIATLLYL